jgi:hypothetical protein
MIGLNIKYVPNTPEMQESIIFKYTPNNTPEVEESILSFKKQIKRIKFTVKENTIQKKQKHD